MASPITALYPYRPSIGPSSLIAQYQGRLWRYNGTVASIIGGPFLSAGVTMMVQAQDYMYVTTGVGPVIRTDGVTSAAQTITNPNTLENIENVSDMLWMRDRMWYAVGDLLYFSEATQPTTIQYPPLRVRQGAGGKIVRLTEYNDGVFLVWKADGKGNGSISVVSTGDNQPNTFSQGEKPLFEKISIVAPRCIVRAGTIEYSDIFFMSREGLRTLKITSLDKLTGANLPISLNLKTAIESINYSAIETSFCEVFEDELFLWVPTDTETLPNTTLAYSLKVPKQNVDQGWVTLDIMPASSAAVIGFSGKSTLYLGTNDGGVIEKAFATAGDSLYREISKRLTFSNQYANYDSRDKTPFKFFLFLDKGSRGTMDVSLIMDDNREFPIGSYTAFGGGVVVPVALPVLLAQPSVETAAIDIHYSGDELIARFKDARVQITSTGFPKVLGWEFICHLEQYRYGSLVTSDTAPILSGGLAEDPIKSGALEPI